MYCPLFCEEVCICFDTPVNIFYKFGFFDKTEEILISEILVKKIVIIIFLKQKVKYRLRSYMFLSQKMFIISDQWAGACTIVPEECHSRPFLSIIFGSKWRQSHQKVESWDKKNWIFFIYFTENSFWNPRTTAFIQYGYVYSLLSTFFMEYSLCHHHFRWYIWLKKNKDLNGKK